MPFWVGQESLTVLQWAARATVAFLWLLLITKLMGQRQIGRLNLFDFVVSISIGSIAGSTLSSPRGELVGAIISIGVIGTLNILISFVNLKHSRLRRVFQDEPIVLIKDGQVLNETLCSARLNLDDLLMELRLKNYPNLSDIEYAILEPNGKVSVIPKSQTRPVTPADLQIKTSYEGMPIVVIEDGNILEDNLKENGLSITWLKEQLLALNIQDPRTVLVAQLDTRGRFYVSTRFL